MSTPQQQFIARIYPAVHKIAQETGVSERLLLAQAAAETGWGQKSIAARTGAASRGPGALSQ